MAASNWLFTSNGAIYQAGAWKGTPGGDPEDLHPYVQPTVDGARVNAAAPLPVREPPTGTPITHGTVTLSGASQTLRTADGARKYITVGNGSGAGIWLMFAAAPAVVGTGDYLPSKATKDYTYAGEVRLIREAGSTDTGTVGFVAW